MVWGEGNGEETGQKKSPQWYFDGKELRNSKQPVSFLSHPGLSVLEIDNVSTLLSLHFFKILHSCITKQLKQASMKVQNTFKFPPLLPIFIAGVDASPSVYNLFINSKYWQMRLRGHMLEGILQWSECNICCKERMWIIIPLASTVSIKEWIIKIHSNSLHRPGHHIFLVFKGSSVFICKNKSDFCFSCCCVVVFIFFFLVTSARVSALGSIRLRFQRIHIFVLPG